MSIPPPNFVSRVSMHVDTFVICLFWKPYPVLLCMSLLEVLPPHSVQ